MPKKLKTKLSVAITVWNLECITSQIFLRSQNIKIQIWKTAWFDEIRISCLIALTLKFACVCKHQRAQQFWYPCIAKSGFEARPTDQRAQKSVRSRVIENAAVCESQQASDGREPQREIQTQQAVIKQAKRLSSSSKWSSYILNRYWTLKSNFVLGKHYMQSERARSISNKAVWLMRASCARAPCLCVYMYIPVHPPRER